MRVSTRGLTIATTACVLLGLAGCATPQRDNLASSADRLQQNTDMLARDAVYGHGDSADSFARDTHALSQDARDFRLTVEDRRSGDAEIRASFDHVSRSFHAVRDEVAHASALQTARDFRPVMDAYDDIEHELGIRPDRDVRGDYPPPVYNQR
jgi:hypothetical protein